MLEAVAGRDVIPSDTDTVADMLELFAERVRSGEITPNRALLVVMHHDVDAYTATTAYVGRATEMFALLEIARVEMLQDVGQM